MVLLEGRGRLSAPSHPAPARREPPADCTPPTFDLYAKLTYNHGMTSITTEPVRSSRLNMRLTPEQRQTIDMAASLKGSSITQWAIDHLVTDARRDIEEETVTRLPSKAFDEFLKALDKPMPQAARDLIDMDPDWL